MHINRTERLELKIQRRKIALPFGAERFLAILEGIEGGFAIGAGIVVGLCFITDDMRLIFVTAMISIVASGFNSAAVKYSTEHYADELDGHEKRNAWKHYFIPALLEFLAYVTVSFTILLPLLIFREPYTVAPLCVAITLLTLFAAGYWRGYLMRRNHALRDAIELSLLGLLIIVAGVASGLILHLLSV